MKFLSPIATSYYSYHLNLTSLNHWIAIHTWHSLGTPPPPPYLQEITSLIQPQNNINHSLTDLPRTQFATHFWFLINLQQQIKFRIGLLNSHYHCHQYNSSCVYSYQPDSGRGLGLCVQLYWRVFRYIMWNRRCRLITHRRWRLRLTSTHDYDTLTLLRRSTMSQRALLYKIIVLYFRYCFSVLSYRSDLALDCLRPECTSRLKVNITILISIKCVYWNGAEIRWASQPTWVYPPKQNTMLLLITKRYSNERHLWFEFYFS